MNTPPDIRQAYDSASRRKNETTDNPYRFAEVAYTIATLVVAVLIVMLFTGCKRAGEEIDPPRKSELNPPATVEELSHFRIVTNGQGCFAIESRGIFQDGGTNWERRLNRFRGTNGCRWDMEWWIAHELRPSRTTNTEVFQPLK